MARGSYPLDAGGPERLDVSWEPSDLFHLAVHLNGKPLANVPLWKALQGTSVRLPDDSFVQIVWRIGPGIIDRPRLTRNGRPLPGFGDATRLIKLGRGGVCATRSAPPPASTATGTFFPYVIIHARIPSVRTLAA